MDPRLAEPSILDPWSPIRVVVLYHFPSQERHFKDMSETHYIPRNSCWTHFDRNSDLRAGRDVTFSLGARKPDVVRSPVPWDERAWKDSVQQPSLRTQGVRVAGTPHMRHPGRGEVAMRGDTTGVLDDMPSETRMMGCRWTDIVVLEASPCSTRCLGCHRSDWKASHTALWATWHHNETRRTVLIVSRVD